MITRCPKCGRLREIGGGRMPPAPPWPVEWGLWMQVAAVADGGAYIQAPLTYGGDGGGKEALRIICPRCGFQMLEPVLDTECAG
jgi:hypothetical protein